MNNQKVGAYIQVGFFILAVIGIVWNASQQSGKINEHERRLLAVENAESSRQEAIARIDARTARMEGTLAIMVDQRQP